MTKDEYKLLANSLKEEERRHASVVSALKAGMKHKHEYKKDGSSAVCRICGSVAFNWYCPSSKDHVCHYRDSFESDDEICIYCGQPEERK